MLVDLEHLVQAICRRNKCGMLFETSNNVRIGLLVSMFLSRKYQKYRNKRLNRRTNGFVLFARNCIYHSRNQVCHPPLYWRSNWKLSSKSRYPFAVLRLVFHERNGSDG